MLPLLPLEYTASISYAYFCPLLGRFISVSYSNDQIKNASTVAAEQVCQKIQYLFFVVFKHPPYIFGTLAAFSGLCRFIFFLSCFVRCYGRCGLLAL